jgi:hypothetical protein
MGGQTTDPCPWVRPQTYDRSCGTHTRCCDVADIDCLWFGREPICGTDSDGLGACHGLTDMSG